MQLGFVSAILGDLPLEEVLAVAAAEKFDCVELMCWPAEKASRRYAGVTHLDVVNLSDAEADRIHQHCASLGVQISGLGYYPNPLHPDPEHRGRVTEHLRRVIEAAPRLGVRRVNTFVGRDWTKSIEDNWPAFDAVWPGIVEHAAEHNVRLGIENCPMLFSQDEWPGGANLAVSPATWRAMFEKIPHPTWGLNFDPSHLVWQMIDIPKCIREFGGRITHVHAKDARIDRHRLDEVGILGLGWHTPKLPGLGDVAWGPFFAALTDAGYDGPVCIEVEDRAFEKSLDDRRRALRQSKRFLEQYMA